MSGSREKLRAVLLSFVMVTSIMAASVAFTGTAAAASNITAGNEASGDNLPQSPVFSESTVQATTQKSNFLIRGSVDGLDFSDNNDEVVLINVPDAVASGGTFEVNGATVEAAGANTDGTVGSTSVVDGPASVDDDGDDGNSDTYQLTIADGAGDNFGNSADQDIDFQLDVDFQSPSEGSYGFNAEVQSGSTTTETDFATLTVDGTSPSIQSVERTGGNTLSITFSEGVFSANDGTGALTASELTYTDNNNRDAGTGNGITSVTHSAGSSTATATVANTIVDADIGSDTVQASGGSQIFDQAGNSAGTSAITVQAQTLPGPATAGTTYAVGGQSDADVVAGSANESLGEIKLRDDPSNSDAAFAGQTRLTFPEGVTVNTSASSLSTTTVITSQNDGVDVTGVSVTNDDRTITIEHSGTSNNGEEIRIANGAVVLNVDATQLDTTGTPTTEKLTLNTFSGEADTDFLKVKSPDIDTGGLTKTTVAAGGDGIDPATTEEVTIERADFTANIEGTTEVPLIGNQTDIVYSLESGTGVTFDTDGITKSNLIELDGDANLDIDGDGTNEFDTSEITVTQNSITVPVVDDVADNDPDADLEFVNQQFDATGDATNTDLNVTIEAPSPSAGPFVSDSASGSLATVSNYVTVAKPDVNIDTADDQLAVGLNQQYLTEQSTNLQSSVGGSAPAIEIVDTSGGQMANGENITLRTNSSFVTFDTSQNSDIEISESAPVDNDANGELDVGVEQNTNSPQIEDATVFSDRIEIQLKNDNTGDDDIIQLDNVALNVSTAAPDETDVEFEVVSKPSASSPDVISASTDSKLDAPNSPTSEQAVTLQRPDIQVSGADQTFDPSSSANLTFDLDNDGFTSKEISGGDNALIIEQSVVGQIADTTNVTISLEDDTGVAFDTTADTGTNTNNPGDGTPTVEANVDGTEEIDVESINIDSGKIDIVLEDETSSDDGDNNDGPDTHLDPSASIVLDDLVVNATGSASNTNISVTTNATVAAPSQASVTDSAGNSGTFDSADNIVTTRLTNIIEVNDVNPNDVKVDPDRSSQDFGSFAFGADQQVDNPQVTNTITSGVKVRDGGSSFGGADVNLEIVQTPNGSNGSSVNTTVVTTNQNGEAFFNFTAGDTVGDYVVNASIDGVSGGVNVTYTAQSGGIDSVNVVPIENAIAGQGQGVSELGVAALFVNATDANGNPVEQTGQVSLSTGDVNADEIQVVNDRDADGSSDSVTGTFSGSFSLDSDGSSVVEVQTSNSGDVTIEAELSGNTDTGTVRFFDNVDTVDLSLNQTTADVDDRVAAEATIEGTDGTAIEVPDVPITIEDDGSGNTTFDGDADSVSVTTDSTGVASTTITAEQLGSADITAQTNLRSDTQTLSIDEEQPPTATVTFDDQTVQNGSTSVDVASATFNGSEDFVIVVHRASPGDNGVVDGTDEIGNKIGSSDVLTSNTVSDVPVNLTKNLDEGGNTRLTENQTLIAMLHFANESGDTNFGSPIVRDGTPVFDQAEITIAPESPLDGPAAEFDEDGDGDIDINELGDAGAAFARGEISIGELGDIGQVFAS